MTIHLTKHHGLGNDFLVTFDTGLDDPADAARRWCDRHRGLGADGLMLASELNDGSYRMVLHNADGSRAEISGNGIRCFAQAVARRTGSLADQRILTDVGERLVTLAPTDNVDTVLASVPMGAVASLDVPEGWAETGCHPDRPVAHLSLGNPHTVVGVDDVGVVDLAALGALVPHINLEIVEPAGAPHEVRMRVHERGVGITEACGTGACAVAFAAVRWGLASPSAGTVVVHMDGGTVEVAVDAPTADQVTLTGEATYIAGIEVER